MHTLTADINQSVCSSIRIRSPQNAADNWCLKFIAFFPSKLHSTLKKDPSFTFFSQEERGDFLIPGLSVCRQCNVPVGRASSRLIHLIETRCSGQGEGVSALHPLGHLSVITDSPGPRTPGQMRAHFKDDYHVW